MVVACDESSRFRLFACWLTIGWFVRLSFLTVRRKRHLVARYLWHEREESANFTPPPLLSVSIYPTINLNIFRSSHTALSLSTLFFSFLVFSSCVSSCVSRICVSFIVFSFFFLSAQFAKESKLGVPRLDSARYKLETIISNTTVARVYKPGYWTQVGIVCESVCVWKSFYL